jgi:TatD DNase family protein
VLFRSATLEELAGDPRVVALGEMGLDYFRDLSPRPVQRQVFAEQLALARRIGKPVVVHMRDAFDDTMAILRESGVSGSKVVFHSFTEGPDQGRQALDFGATIGFSGIVTFQHSHSLRAAAAIVPDDRILIETDSPYLSPEPVRGSKPNEPANVVHVAAALAALRSVSLEGLAERTTANAVQFFLLPEEGLSDCQTAPTA